MKKTSGITLLGLTLALVSTSLGNALAKETQAFTSADYVSLATLREQAAQGWVQTYTAKGRSIEVNVGEIPMPAAVECPVIEVTPWGKGDVQSDIFESQWDTKLLKSAMFDNRVVASFWDNSLSTNYTGRTETPEDFIFENGAIPTQPPQGMDMDYEAFLGQVNRDLQLISKLTLDDFLLKELRARGITYQAKERNGEVVLGDPITKNGDYSLLAYQRVRGIPMLDVQNMAEDVPIGMLRYFYANAQNFHFALYAAKEEAVRIPDIPLLSFPAFKRVLEAQIEAGHLRGVDKLDFGYLAFYEGSKNSRVWLLLPVWRIEGGYTKDANTKNEVMPYHDPRDTDGSITYPMGYSHYFYSAQTGDMLPTGSLVQKNDVRIPAWDVEMW